MRVLVTGCAGFIGSWVAEALLRGGHEVLGVDCFVDFYPRRHKEANLRQLEEWAPFRFVEADISEVDDGLLREWLGGYPFVSHQAAQAGVRSSWGRQFEDYTRYNILATQRLLEAAKEVSVQRFVFASSSSVYGQADVFPLREDGPTLPVSPYGVTKLAAEHLTRLYYLNYGVPTVALRYFTVYGPRQRPDMAFTALVTALAEGTPFRLFGDGSAARSFTYVADAAAAVRLALTVPTAVGGVYNVGSGITTSLAALAQRVIAATGSRSSIRLPPAGQPTGYVADLTRSRADLGYQPAISLDEGLTRYVAWLRDHRADPPESAADAASARR